MVPKLGYLILLAWVAVFTSQSLVDVSDTLIVISALFIAFKKNNLKDILSGFVQKNLFVVWLFIVLLGLAFSDGVGDIKAWLPLFEFRWILSFLSLIYIWKYVDQKKLIYDFLPWVLLALNFVALVIFFEKSSDRAGGILNQIMSFSHSIGPTAVLVTMWTVLSWKTFSKKQKIIFSTVVATSMLLTVLTVTRGVWLSVAVSLVLSSFLINKKFFAASLVLVLVVFTALGLSSHQVRERFTLDSEEVKEGSNYIRVALLKANWEIVKDYPVLGVGLGQNKNKLPEYYQRLGYTENVTISHAHNQYLEMWANTGTLGLLCFIVFYGFILNYALKAFKYTNSKFVKALSLSLFSALLSFMLGSLTECNFNISKNRYFFLVLASWALSLYALRNTYEDRNA